MRKSDGIFLRMVIVVPIVMLGLLFAKFSFNTDEVFVKDLTSVSSYLTVMGTLYSILVAFIIVTVWAQYNRCNDAVDKEADDLGDLIKIIGYLNDPRFEKRMTDVISDYAKIVVEDEWKKLANRTKSPEAEKAFDIIYEEIKTVKFDDHRDPIVFGEIIKKYNDVSDARHQRISASMEQMPSILKVLHYIVSVSVILGFFLLSIDNNIVAVTITVLTTLIVIFIVEVIEDLNNAYTGKWAVNPDGFKKLIL